MEGLPLITLDTTLADLYSQAGLDTEHQHLAHLHTALTSTCHPTPGFLTNKRYVYLDSSLRNCVVGAPDHNARRSLSVKMLSLIPQRDAFVSGDAKVICFHTGNSSTTDGHDKLQFTSTIGTLNPKQQPTVLFCGGPGEVAKLAGRNGSSALTSKFVLDGVVDSIAASESQLRSLVDVEKHWYLNSKVALASSGLPTPNALILEITEHQGQDGRAREDRIMSIISAIRATPLPFVVKGNQSFGGAGTWIISSEGHHEALIEELPSVIRKLLSFVNITNQHLQIPTTLIMDMVRDVVHNVGLTFFVNADGTPVFFGVSVQMIDQSSSAWIGSTVTFSAQSHWKDKLYPLMQQIAIWLHSHSYIGPVGADVLETSAGEHVIVDLNVRTTGSMCLPLLRTHFTSRGFDCASSVSITLDASRKEFVAAWNEEFERGKFVIVAWYEEAGASSFATVVVGAEDEERLAEMIAKVRQGSQAVTF